MPFFKDLDKINLMNFCKKKLVLFILLKIIPVPAIALTVNLMRRRKLANEPYTTGFKATL